MRLSLLLALAATLYLLHPVPAAQAEQAKEHASPAIAIEDLPDARAAMAYLNNLKTLKARFIQTDPAGKQLAGTFMLKRPGRMRFEYDAPVTDFIVADGTFVHYYDGQMKQQSSAPIGQSLANFFLREKIAFSGDIRLDGVRREDDLLLLTLTQRRDPLAGSLILAFKRGKNESLTLHKWRVVDATGAITEVALHNVAAGIELKNNLFHYYDPTRGGSPLNR